MYDSITGINYSTCIGQWEITLNLQDSIDCLSHYFSFSLDRASAQVIFFKYIITHRISVKKTFQLFNGPLDIIKIYFYEFIHI